VNQLALFALLGLGTGALIAGIAVGLVQNYRGSGVTNLALGAVAMLGGYEFYVLRTAGSLWLPLPAVPLIHLGSPWGLAPSLVVALAACALTGALFDVAVLRRLRGAPALAKLVASLGLLLTLQAIAIQRFGVGGQSAPNVLPAGPSDVVRIFGGVVPTDRFVLTGIVVALTAALAAAYKYSRFGLATRAAAEDEAAADLSGLAPQTISVLNTTGAFVLAGALGILVAPTSQLDPTTLTLAVIPALGAALLARFTSFGIAAASGIVMGIIQSELIYLQTKS
jgi:branched-chain amino acid transport system permease protein